MSLVVLQIFLQWYYTLHLFFVLMKYKIIKVLKRHFWISTQQFHRIKHLYIYIHGNLKAQLLKARDISIHTKRDFFQKSHTFSTDQSVLFRDYPRPLKLKKNISNASVLINKYKLDVHEDYMKYAHFWNLDLYDIKPYDPLL